ncbi:hypothetical protein [Streptomyces mesophilus]|uniref:hypothetical protein n=1 Tax=Streptomyces mesophilus TaxID=1775132 RepID=UPI00331AFB57
MNAVGTARLVVQNSGTEPLELSVEPWADAHQLAPGETVVVVTHSPTAGGVWPGSRREGEPFQVNHQPDAVVVWANGNCFHLTDQDGTAIEAADWECPARRQTR